MLYRGGLLLRETALPGHGGHHTVVLVQHVVLSGLEEVLEPDAVVVGQGPNQPETIAVPGHCMLGLLLVDAEPFEVAGEVIASDP